MRQTQRMTATPSTGTPTSVQSQLREKKTPHRFVPRLGRTTSHHKLATVSSDSQDRPGIIERANLLSIPILRGNAVAWTLPVFTIRADRIKIGVPT